MSNKLRAELRQQAIELGYNENESEIKWPSGSVQFWEDQVNNLQNAQNQVIVDENLLGEIVIDDIPDNQQNPVLVRNYLRDNNITGEIRIIHSDRDNIINDNIFNIPENFTNQWYTNNIQPLYYGTYTHNNVFTQIREDEDYDDDQRIIIMRPNNIAGEDVIQFFQEGYKNCLLTPIENDIIARMEILSNPKTIKNYQTKLNKINKLQQKYINGVPKSDLQYICDHLGISISILDVSLNQIIEVKSKTHVRGKYQFINTKFNHVEVLLNNNPIEVSPEDMNKYYKEITMSGQYYCYKRSKDKIIAIYTESDSYILRDEKTIAINNFNKHFNIDKCKINYTDQKDLSEFILSGCYVSQCVDYMTKKEHKYHIDQTKSYTQFKNNKYYKGFPGIITDFRKVPNDINFIKQNIGYYLISEMNIDKCDENIINHLEELGIGYHSRRHKDPILDDLSKNSDTKYFVYPSIELEYYYDLGIRFNIHYGAYGVNPLHFDYYDCPEDCNLINNGGYKIHAGRLHMIRKDDSFYFKCDKQLSKQMKYNYGNTFQYYSSKSEGVLKLNRNKINHTAHISGFIYAYSRISILNQVFKINPKNVIRVELDGIYHCQDNVELTPTFRIKQGNFNNNTGGWRYYFKDPHNIEFKNDELTTNHITLYSGAGGTGKTHTAILEQTVSNIIYSTVSHKLVNSKINDYDIKGCTLQKLTNTNCFSDIVKGPYPAVIIVDEISMISKFFYDKIINMYPYSKIIFCGDLKYQLQCIEGESITINMFNNIREFDVNYRCKCPELKKILDINREAITNNKNLKSIYKLIIKEYKDRIITPEELKNIYSINDYILAPRRTCGKCKKNWCDHSFKISNNHTQYYTDMFRGKFSEEKYLLLSNTSNGNNGEIVISDTPPNTKSEIRHCFTIHQIQGETISDKIFIHLKSQFDLNMIYTAISRAQYLDQIYFIR